MRLHVFAPDCAQPKLFTISVTLAFRSELEYGVPLGSKVCIFSGTKNNFSATKNNISGTKNNFSATKNNFSATKIN